MKVKYVFVLVVYRNYTDLENYLKTLNKNFKDYKAIVINSYYDDLSMNEIKRVSLENNAIFINASNEGYGAGNNKGIRYAIENYDFEFLIVSNCDMDILKFDDSVLDSSKPSLYGPQINTLNGKNQNPYWSNDFNIGQRLMYRGFKKNKKFSLYLGIAMNKCFRLLSLFITKIFPLKLKRCFGLHGSFLIYTKKAIEILGEPYDEEMFLFSEEAYLAHLAKQKGIKSFYTRKIKIKHFEDGSVSLIDTNGIEAKSYIHFYKQFHRVKEK